MAGSDCESELPYVPPHPGNAYALSKEIGEGLLERVAHQTGVPCVALRLSAVLSKAEVDRVRRGRPPTDWRLDEAFAYLTFDNDAALTEALLRVSIPDYHMFLPAAHNHLLGWPTQDIIQTYYPRVPLLEPADPLRNLVNASERRDFSGWEPTG